MTPQFILWGLPGFIAYYLLQSIKPSRAKSGWDFVVEVGLLSLVCFVVSHGTLYYAKWLVPDLVSWAKLYWPREYPFALAFGLFPVAEIVGVGLAKTNRQWARLRSLYHKAVTGRVRNFEFSDVFFATCDELLGKMILLTLSSGKVYVGILVAATQDPNEARRYVSFVPVLSGYRADPNLKVAYTTFYDPSAARPLLVPAEQVMTLGGFDWDRFDHFVRSGDITIEISSQQVS